MLHLRCAIMVMSCLRCETKVELTVPPHETVFSSYIMAHHFLSHTMPLVQVTHKCSKCSTVLSVRLRAMMVHQSSVVLGVMHADQCSPVDLLIQRSSFSVDVS